MTAKEKFQKSNTFRDAVAVLASEHFERAAEVTLLIMVENQAMCDNPVSGNNMHQQMIGARRFLSIMQGLIRTDEGPKTERRDTLKPTS